MKFVSLKFGQGNSESTVADEIAQDESPGAAGSGGSQAPVPQPVSNVIPSSESALNEPERTNWTEWSKGGVNKMDLTNIKKVKTS
jgi:hypothetical protein